MRKWIIIIVVILAGVGLWLYLGISAVVSAERDLLARLDDTAQFYVSIDANYIQPLLTNSAFGDADKATVAAISTQLKTLAESKNPNEQFTNLLPVQRAMIGFFATQDLPNEFVADSRYVNWNKNATNLGEASSYILAYNTALSRYNAELNTPAGNIARYWHVIEHRSYIGIDGSLQDQTHVSF
ncbi:MAG: hypothetical protein KBC47_02215 [Candidatus Peribacteraceae bacterium]|nr:hypothetical protein [Candidatus Peribacteraceae bacterium]